MKHRRDFLQFTGLSAVGFSLCDWFRCAALGATLAERRARNCILIWLDGGPSHLESFDLKPLAPQEVRGPFEPISTKVTGIEICEHLSQTAKVVDKLAIIRSVTSPLGEHGLANHYLLTGYKPSNNLVYPSLGSVTGSMHQNSSPLPKYVSIGQLQSGGSGFLGTSYDPFLVGDGSQGVAGTSLRVADLDLFPGVTQERLERRQRMLGLMDSTQRRLEQRLKSPSQAKTLQEPATEQAFRLLSSSQARQAFDLEQESTAVHQRYGSRMLGQSCLLARRLIERDVPFVSIANTGWDTHENLVLSLRDGFSGAKVGVGLLPTFDQAFSALIEDLDQRGLLAHTLVVAMGEFGRTPKLNTRGGRDHWPGVFSVVMAGGGVVGGQVIGSSDSVGERPHDTPVTPADLACSIYTLLGIDARRLLTTPEGRAIAINRDGNVIPGLVS